MNDSEEPPESYDFDLIIIGGGSGGLAAAKARPPLCYGVWVMVGVQCSHPGLTVLPPWPTVLHTGCVFPINLGKDV